MERVWLDTYTPGTPDEIDPDAYPSLVALIDEAVDRFGDRPAFENMGVRITFAELDRLAADFAGYLASRPDLDQGDRVALMMPNCLQYPVALLGALRAGLVVVNTNPLYTARELRHQLGDSGARAIVVLENFARELEECIDETDVRHVVVTGLGDMLGFPKSLLVNFVVRHVKRMVPPFRIDGAIRWQEALDAGSGTRAGEVKLGGGDLAFLQYTGGTTGVSKGAMLTNRNMVACILQMDAFLRPFAREGEDVIVTALPLYHIFALTANCITYMRFGGMNLLITNPRDMKGFVKTLTGARFSAITGVNTLFNGLLNTKGFADLDFSSLRISVGGGMAVQSAVAHRWKDLTGVALLEGYGLTETAPAACMNPFHFDDYTGTVGVPMPSTECLVIDENGYELSADTPGELCIRGPQVMAGYWNRPDETRAVIDGEGWLRTGDIAEIDARGFVRIVDRKKDMILVSGFNVYPNEVEEVVSKHPDVLEVGAIGVPDELSGEAVKIVVVKRSPALTEESLQSFCRENLTGYKCPRYIEFADDLPKTNIGKILRRELRERFARPGPAGG